MRRMIDEPKDVRLPIMVTRSEAEMIDNWRYENRVPTRAEAMRRLIDMGGTTAKLKLKLLLLADAARLGSKTNPAACWLMREELLHFLYSLDVQADDAHAIMDILLHKPVNPAEEGEVMFPRPQSLVG